MSENKLDINELCLFKHKKKLFGVKPWFFFYFAVSIHTQIGIDDNVNQAVVPKLVFTKICYHFLVSLICLSLMKTSKAAMTGKGINLISTP